MIIKKLPN